MKIFTTVFLILTIVLARSASATTYIHPTLDLEKKIAYQQGQFGALYAHCGSKDQQAVIGSSLATWRFETFRGYNGTALEKAALEKSFDDAATSVMSDATSCQDWVKAAAATWHGIINLSQYGTPVAANP